MDLPPNLISQVREGRSVLFLGAGATVGAKTPAGKKAPVGDKLRDLINDRFLGGKFSGDSLSWVGELAASATNLFTVQDFIAEQFIDLIPADFHLLIPTFKWRGIATTNYDRIVEDSYRKCNESVQYLVPFLSNSDKVDENLRNPSSVALLKLHGCITRTHDDRLPLILSADQYVKHRKSRFRLFQMLEDWGSEYSIIFIGHRLQDPNLRSLLLELDSNIVSRPRYYIIRPGINNEERDFWATKSFTCLDCGFSDFLNSLSSEIPKSTRKLAVLLTTDHPIKTRFIVREEPSQSLMEFLARDYEYVFKGIKSETGKASLFYSGFSLGWYPILHDLDVSRKITDTILDDIILRVEDDRPSLTEMYVIKAEAGSGKSVLLRRLAWQAAVEANALCLFSNGVEPSSLEPIREIAKATGERIFLFVDNAADLLQMLIRTIEFAKKAKIKVTIITAERANEWNINCESLENYMTDQYRLRYLSENEIKDLLALLDKHDCLGPNLATKDPKERVDEFTKRAGRQLLVALHEATKGRPFEEILIDEYRNIVPERARRLYLTVCVLNRLKVPVRAGLISRIHQIPFEEFRDNLFKPLEHVVRASKLSFGDYAYMARHSEIAQIVFQEILVEANDRFQEYVRIIRGLNPMYSVDMQALRGLLQAKHIDDLFPNYDDAKSIYEVGLEILADNAYILQQRANYERIRSSGNLNYAIALLEKARELAPRDDTIIHTLAEVYRSKAGVAEKPLERKRLRSEARDLLSKISSRDRNARYSAVTMLKIAIDAIEDILNDQNASDQDIDHSVRNTDKILLETKQRYPNDKYVLLAEAAFGKIVKDHERIFQALKKANHANPRDPYIASRLALIYEDRADIGNAQRCIEDALESNRSDKQLNFMLAELLRKRTNTKGDALSYYYRRAFSKWDQNYQSQFWYARFAFESDENEKREESREIFRHLREASMPFDDRIKILDAIGDLDNPRAFTGMVKRVEATHGFITVDGSGEWLFFHMSDVVDDSWVDMAYGVRVNFAIGFCYYGPRAVKVKPK